jgi:hypothetical protein
MQITAHSGVPSLSKTPLSCIFAIFIIYRVSQEECARLQEGVPYVKIY